MQLNVYGGTQNSLMFPVLCDAYLTVEYSKNIAYQTTGIWDHKGSFTVEMIVTPYDVNGWGDNADKAATVSTVNNSRGKQSSLKTMPAVSSSMSYPNALANLHEDIDYLPVPHRQEQKMNLFYNSNLQISLKNTTTHNQNNPAEYSLLASMTIDGVTQTIESPTVVASRDKHYGYYNNYPDYLLIDPQGAAYAKLSVFTAASGTGTNLTMNSSNYPETKLCEGQELWLADGTSLGTIMSINTSTRVFSMSKTLPTISSGATIWIGVNKEAIYLESTYHFAFTFDNSSRMMYLYCNGQEVMSARHNSNKRFSFHPSSIYIGQNPTAANNYLKRITQFMGEYHELSVTEGYKSQFNSLYTLLPQFRDTLLYLDFEEVDE